MDNNKTNIINILDSTLREGRQAPGVCLNDRQIQEIVLRLNTIGIDMLEVGHPVISDEHFQTVQKCVKLSAVPCLAHARACLEDVLAVHASGAAWVGIFAGINEVSQKYRLNKNTQEILMLISESITYAKKLGLKVRYTVEDASKTDESDLVLVYEAAIAAGADRICFADTLGVLEPTQVSRTIQLLRSRFENIEIEVHFHDDRGLAMANALAAIDAGANWVSSSVNGLGERCGITDTLALIANLDFRGSRQYEKQLSQLKGVSELVAAHARAWIDDRRPVVGKYAFTHTSKLHIDTVKRSENAYAWRDPKDFNRSNDIFSRLLVSNLETLTNVPVVISASELKYHRHGPGSRYVMIDDRFINDCRQYCIVRDVEVEHGSVIPPHVDIHRHKCDSLFLFLGKDPSMAGLTVIVTIENDEKVVHSPAAIFIPAGLRHTYRILEGSGFYINHVLSGNYNDSLLEEVTSEKLHD